MWPGVWCRNAFQRENQKRWNQARGLTGELPAVEKWTEEETDVLYGKSLEWGATIAGRAVEGDESRQKVWAEYREFLGENAYGVTVESARAKDVLAFVRGYWIPRHLSACRTVVKATGSKVVAMSTVKKVVDYVSKSYEMLGREGRENPAKGEAVQAFKEGYRKMLHNLGVKEKKAVVFKEGKFGDLVAFAVKEIEKLPQSIER
jgi:hypothetical protein